MLPPAEAKTLNFQPAMKKLLTTLLLATPLAQADNKAYLNFIIQIQGNPINTTHKIDDIDASGKETALQGVFGSSVFQLWTIHRSDWTEYLLDEKTVSSYHPQATLQITSADPYEAVPRTRVDKPFNIKYTIDGIITNDPSVQDAAKSVVFDHRIYKYASGASSVPEGAAHTVKNHDPISKNGTFNINNIYTEIQSTDLPRARGEEIFSIYANPDFGVVGATLLAQQRVQIWPIAYGSISGIDTTTEYSKIPDITINLVDLYPDSSTYVRYYKGAPTAAPASAVNVNSSYVTIDDVEPVNRSYILTSLNEKIKEDGQYTVEIIHTTPFGADLLAQVYPLKVERAIEVNGNITSSE